jgi:predicted porin
MLGGSISAQAADLGGDCCADLEERVAELEATTARKGNRKVSLKISGWVNEQLLFWDDEIEQNVYVGNNDQERSRFKFAGDAKIDGEWSAGYTLEIGVRTTRSSAYSQDDDEGGSSAGTLDIRKSSWFIKSKKLGKFTMGRDGSATYHILDDADITNTRYYADAESMPTIGANSFFLTAGNSTSSLRWASILSTASNRSPGNGERPDIIRYNSPEFGGFEVVAAWGEDDLWDAALVYEGKVGDFELAGRVGYAEYTDESSGPGSDHCLGPSGSVSGIKCREFGASGTIWHKPSGLYVYGAYGQLQDDRYEATDLAPVDDEDRLYYVQVGIEKKWYALGKTTVFGTYRHDDVGARGTFGGPAGLGLAVADEDADGDTIPNYLVSGSDVDTWGGGVVQNIEAAAMDLYLIYSHIDGDFDALCIDGKTCALNSVTNIELNSLQLLQAGARIQF